MEKTFSPWDINTHTEMPIATHKMKGGSQCISKLAWSQKGDMLAVGDDIGRIEEARTDFASKSAGTSRGGAGDFRSSRMAGGL